MTALAETACWIEGDGVRLEGRMHEGTTDLAAVVLHPHPQYGGDMDNHVVAAIADALAGLGASTLRFNFRGAGRSSGSFDGHGGEVRDVEIAVAMVRARQGTTQLLLAGYSFGAMIAAAAAESVRPDAMILVSPPLAYGDLPALPPAMPVLAIAGDADTVAPAEAVRALESAGTRALIVAGADHGWWPGIDTLVAEIRSFAERMLLPR